MELSDDRNVLLDDQLLPAITSDLNLRLRTPCGLQ